MVGSIDLRPADLAEGGSGRAGKAETSAGRGRSQARGRKPINLAQTRAAPPRLPGSAGFGGRSCNLHRAFPRTVIAAEDPSAHAELAELRFLREPVEDRCTLFGFWLVVFPYPSSRFRSALPLVTGPLSCRPYLRRWDRSHRDRTAAGLRFYNRQ